MRLTKLSKSINHLCVAVGALSLSAGIYAAPAAKKPKAMKPKPPMAIKPITLNSVLPGLMERNSKVKASMFDLKSAKPEVWEAISAWLPQLSTTDYIGQEKIDNDSSDDTDLYTREAALKLTQLVYDFGKTGSAIDTAKEALHKAVYGLEETRQEVMLEGITGFLQVINAREALNYSRRNARDIEKQLAMEQKRVKQGQGYTSNLLEVQGQLSGAMARIARAKGTLTSAKNSYEKTFEVAPGAVDSFVLPKVPYKALPKSLKEALSYAKEHNLSLLTSNEDVASARTKIRSIRADFAPKIEVIGESKFKKNASGTAGHKEEYSAKLQLTYPFFSGGKDFAALQSAKFKLESAEQTLSEDQFTVDEEIRNAWQDLSTQRRNLAELNKQVSRLRRFLDLAVKERQLGRRSVIDVLFSDKNYIEALIAKAQAEKDMRVAAYTMLEAMGKLNLTMFSPVTAKQITAMKRRHQETKFHSAAEKKTAADLQKARAAAMKRRAAAARAAAARKKQTGQAAQGVQQQRRGQLPQRRPYPTQQQGNR